MSDDFLDYVLDQLGGAGIVSARRMFGGAGLYLDGTFFGLIADNVFYLKADARNRPRHEEAGMGPFRPFGKKSYAMSFYEVPADVLEDSGQLESWAREALAAALRSSAGGTKRKKKASKGTRTKKKGNG